MKLRAIFCSAIILLPSFGAAQSVSVKDGNIFLVAADGNSTQLTATGRDSDPALAPDRKRIVFVRATLERRVSTGSVDETSELWLVQSDGSKSTRILEPRSAENMEQVLASLSRPQFSSDGRRIVSKRLHTRPQGRFMFSTSPPKKSISFARATTSKCFARVSTAIIYSCSSIATSSVAAPTIGIGSCARMAKKSAR